MSNEVTAPQRNARAHILETAWRLVGERGVQEVTVADIAAASGVSRQLVYHHFESRAGLLVAMTRHHDTTSGFRTRLVATAGGLAPVEGLETALRLWLRLRARGPPHRAGARGRAHHGRRGRARPGATAWTTSTRPSASPSSGSTAPAASADGWTVDTAADWVYARSHVSTWQHLVADRGWPASDYVERTIASIMAEVVAPAEDE